jgi:hypothetical protein
VNRQRPFHRLCGALLAFLASSARAQAPDAAPPEVPLAEAPASPPPGPPTEAPPSASPAAAPEAPEGDAAEDSAAAEEIPAYDEQAEADARAMLAEIEASQSTDVVHGVSLSGFTDFNYAHFFKAGPLLQSGNNSDSFFMGRANLYIRGTMTEHFRSLMEIRFTYLPNGALDGEGGYTRTAIPDYADYNRTTALGGILLERIHADYEFDQRFTLRVGQFLTPYGVWNVDHGSPAVIPVGIPYAIGQAMFPQRQTGLEGFGRVDLNDKLTLQYHLTVSNGRGPFESHLDLDKNKALGARVRLIYQGKLGDIALGASGYYGRNTDANPKNITTGETQIVLQADELAVAGDLRWVWRGLHLQTEFVQKQTAYTDKGRQYRVPDRSSWGGYGLLGYRIPRLEVMPFVMFQRQSDEYFNLRAASFGLNYRPIPELVVKLSETLETFSIKQFSAHGNRLDAQFAWAF